MSWLYYHTQKTKCVLTLKSGKANYESLKCTFDEKFKSTGISDKGGAASINKFKKERFLELSGEEQEEWTQKAIADHENAKAEMKDHQGLPPPLSPKDTQMYVLL
jgi:hypothetical protein